MRFHELHHQASPLLLANVWDVPSARLADRLGYQALGTSSGAMATLLGYEDGEQMPFPEMLLLVRRIAEATHLPLSVDLEGGYSRDPREVARHIRELAALGVAGINLEDSIVGPSGRQLLPAGQFAKFLSAIRAGLSSAASGIFFNIRTDTFLLGQADLVEETLRRAHAYEAAGADGLFVPCITREDHIRAVVAGTKLPLNVMCMPELPTFPELAQWGVRRISMGNFAFEKINRLLGSELQQIRNNGDFQSLFQA